MADGWIKLHRKLLESPCFDNEKLLKIWIWCLLKTTHTEYVQLIGLQEIELKPGQFITGRNRAAEELKMNPSTFWKYIQLLKSMGNISVKSNNKFSIITIDKWELYQSDEEKNNNKITTKEQQNNTNKNGKNNKNKYINTQFEEFWQAYPKKRGKSDADKAFKKIKPDGELFEKILKAIAIQKQSNDWLKENGQYIPYPATWLNGKRWADEDITLFAENDDKPKIVRSVEDVRRLGK